jgi:type IV secretory pathway VirB10-like protein
MKLFPNLRPWPRGVSGNPRGRPRKQKPTPVSEYTPPVPTPRPVRPVDGDAHYSNAIREAQAARDTAYHAASAAYHAACQDASLQAQRDADRVYQQAMRDARDAHNKALVDAQAAHATARLAQPPTREQQRQAQHFAALDRAADRESLHKAERGW